MKKCLLFFSLLLCTGALSQAQQNIQLTFERERALLEDTIFNALGAVRFEDPRAVSGYYSGVLSTLTVREVQSKPIQVKKGDAFSLHTYALYQSGSNKKLVKKLALAIAAGVATKQISRTVDNSEGTNKNVALDAIPYAVGGTIAIPAIVKYLKGRPKGSLTWELYNEQRKLISAKTIKIGGHSKNSWQLIEESILATEDGYLMLRLGNEAKAPVWFDDLELIKTGKPELSRSDKPVKLLKQDESFYRITILSMTSNTDAGCGDEGEENCCETTSSCYIGPCGDEVECDVCDMSGLCYDECTCTPTFCEEDDPCDDPSSCECDPRNCNNDDPCEDDYFSCECNPQNCEPDPCSTDPNTCECNPNNCQPQPDCAGVINGNAYRNSCGHCVGGTTGRPHNFGCAPRPPDCAGVAGGSATYDACGTCIGGTTGKFPIYWYADVDQDGFGDPNNVKYCYNPHDANYKAVISGHDNGDNCYNLQNSPNQCGGAEYKVKTVYNSNVCAGYRTMLGMQDSTDVEMTAFSTTSGNVIIFPYVTHTEITSEVSTTYKDAQGRNIATWGFDEADSLWHLTVIDYIDGVATYADYVITGHLHSHPTNGNENDPSPQDYETAQSGILSNAVPHYIINSSNVVRFNGSGIVATTPLNQLCPQ